MKKFLPIISIAASMLICCSCSASSASENSSENSTVVYVEEKTPEQIEFAELWETLDKSEMQTFTNESDGVILTVLTDKREYTVGEPIKIKAEAQNITDGELWYVCGYSIKNYPIEIHTNILGDGRYLESNRSDDFRNSVMVYFPMKPGEVYDDYETFDTGYYSGEPAEPGVYNGTCYISTVSDKDSYEYTEHSVDFSIEIKPHIPLK